MAHRILTIGRKLGSGGRELGERVAESLGIPFFDQNLISMAAERGDLAESYLARFDEKKHSTNVKARAAFPCRFFMLPSLIFPFVCIYQASESYR